MKSFTKYPLAFRQLVYVLLFASCVSLLTITLQLFLEYKRDVSRIETQFDLIKSSYLKSLSGSLWNLDDAQIKALLNGILSFPEIKYLEVELESGTHFRVGNRVENQKSIRKDFLLAYENEHSVKIPIGTLAITASLKETFDLLSQRIFTVLLTEIPKAFLISLFMFYVLYQLVTRHFISLADFTSKLKFDSLDKGLTLQRKSNPKNPDELDQIVSSLNNMRVILKDEITKKEKARHDLKKAHEGLEKRVQERTLELRESNNRLEQEIAERQQLQKSTQESEAQKQAILNGMTADISFINEQFEILWINKASAESAKRQPEEMLGKKCHCFWGDPEIPCPNCPAIKVVQTKKPERAIITSPDGRIWDERSEPAFDTDGKLIGTIQISQDITAQYQVEQALKESEEKFRNLFDQAPEQIIIVGLDGTILDHNHEFTPFGFHRDEIIGVKYNELGIFGQDNNKYEAVFARCIEGNTEPFEVEIEAQSGDKIWMEIHPALVNESGQNSIRFTVRDITGRKTAETALHESKERYTALFDRLQDAVFIVDLQGDFIDANPAALKMFDYKGDENQTINVASLVDTQQMTLVYDILKEVKRSGSQSKPAQFNLKKRNGDYFWVESTVVLLYQDGKPFGIQGIARDISKRKEVEEQLTIAKEKAETANKLKSEFLANISHELRTPMQGILGYARLGIDRVKSLSEEKTAAYFQEIHISGQRLMGLLNNLLDLSKLESNAVEFNFKPERLGLVTETVINELYAIINEKELKVIFEKFDFDDVASLDVAKIGQVIRNLLGNAIKFSKRGSKIEIAIHPKDSQLLFTISDNGIGIPERELGEIFDKFVQSSKNKNGAGGTGLGLSISKKIIEIHKGKIWAEENPAGGAILKFQIPVQQNQTG